MKNGVADYIVTGQWAKKAYAEAQKYGKANKIASSEDKTFSYIPDCSDLPISPDADYVYICENNTIYGTKYKKLPNTKGKTWWQTSPPVSSPNLSMSLITASSTAVSRKTSDLPEW